MKKIERPLLNGEPLRSFCARACWSGRAVFLRLSSRAKGEARVSGLAQRVAEGMGTLGKYSRMMSEAASTPALNDLIPRGLRNGPRLKAGVT